MYNDEYDPNANGGYDPSAGSNVGPPTRPNDQALRDAIIGMYRKALGRDPSPDEIDLQIRGGSGDPATIQRSIAESPEAQAFAAKNVTVPPPGTPPPPAPGGTPPPRVTTQPPPGTGGPGDGRNLPVPTPTPTPTPAPTFNPPSYTPPPAFTAPPPFSYEDWREPSAGDLFNDPGYQTRAHEGTQALEQSAAAKGILNTGGTLKDVLRFGQDLASQEYGAMRDRRFSAYQANRSNAFDTYKGNYGIAADVADRNYTSQYKDPFAFAYQGSRDAYDSASHNYDQNAFYKSHNSDLDRMYAWNKIIQDYTAGRNTKLDDFDQKYKLLGLL